MTGFSHDDVAALPWGDDNWKERKAPEKIQAEKLKQKGAFKIHSVVPSYDYRGRPNGITVHAHVNGRHHEMDTSRAEAAKLHTYAKKYHGATTPPARIEHIKEAPKMKTLSQLKEELAEATDITLHRHDAEGGTHYTVHKIHPKSGIADDQLKQGEKLNDTHVDDLRDMGYSVKIHKAKALKENIEDEHSETYYDHEELAPKVKDAKAKKAFVSEFTRHSNAFAKHYDRGNDEQAGEALGNMQDVNDRMRKHIRGN